jgi:hypothetical protein
MNEYDRQHSSGNMSKGIYLILFGGLAAIGIYKVAQFVRNYNQLHDIEMEEIKQKNNGDRIIIIDSARNIDTQFLKDFPDYDAAADTIKSRH